MVYDWIKAIKNAGLHLTEMKCIRAAEIDPDDIIILKIKDAGRLDYIQYRQIRDSIRQVCGPERKVLIVEDKVDIFVLKNALARPSRKKEKHEGS
jgi:hypothetical protein